MAPQGGGSRPRRRVMQGGSEAGFSPPWGPSFESVLDGWMTVAREDREVALLMAREADRERRTMRLIASENYVSPAVLAALSATLSNKYANGYAGRRKYPGCEWADEIEMLAIERAKEVFGGDHVNVQPHSGSQANLAAYLAVLSPGDTLLALHPEHGGHFTHGGNGNFSSAFFRVEHFGVDRASGLIDLAAVERRAEQVQPKAIVIGATTYPRRLDVEGLAGVARSVDALLIVDAAHIIGLVAAEIHPDPVACADLVTFTTHKTLRGPRGGAIICKQELAERVDAAVFPMVQGGPNLGVIAAKAVAFREARAPSFSVYARRAVSLAEVMANSFSEGGLRVLTDGTDTHIVLVDLSELGMDGEHAERGLAESGILANRSRIPFDPLEAGESGLRFGTAAVATLGMSTDEMARLAHMIVALLRDRWTPVTRYEAASLVARLHARLAPYTDPFEHPFGERIFDA